MPNKQPITIVVDAGNGQRSTDAVVRAVAKQSRRAREDRYFQIVGDEPTITQCLNDIAHNAERIGVVHSEKTIAINTPTSHLELSGSSIDLACRLVEDGIGHAVVSPGNRAATVSSAIERFQRMPHVRQPALVAQYPTSRPSGGTRDRLSLLLDVGATMRADEHDLLSFALMGSEYAKQIGGILNPRVALLANGTDGFGPPEITRAHALLGARKDLHYCGTIEGSQIPIGDFDVVVCEGFVGDIALKLLEGAGDAVFALAQSAYEARFSWRMGLRLLSGGLQRIKSAVDFESYGGEPLLGLNQVVIVTDPRSTDVAMDKAIDLAFTSYHASVPEIMSEALQESVE